MEAWLVKALIAASISRKTRNCSECKNLLETKKKRVVRNTKSCQNVAEQLVASPSPCYRVLKTGSETVPVRNFELFCGLPLYTGSQTPLYGCWLPVPCSLFPALRSLFPVRRYPFPLLVTSRRLGWFPFYFWRHNHWLFNREGVGWDVSMHERVHSRPWRIVLLKVAYYATSSARNFAKLCQNYARITIQTMLLISEIMLTKCKMPSTT